ncbi:unnamed protein product, partial [Amoebophrya sp. A25]
EAWAGDDKKSWKNENYKKKTSYHEVEDKSKIKANGTTSTTCGHKEDTSSRYAPSKDKQQDRGHAARGNSSKQYAHDYILEEKDHGKKAPRPAHDDEKKKETKDHYKEKSRRVYNAELDYNDKQQSRHEKTTTTRGHGTTSRSTREEERETRGPQRNNKEVSKSSVDIVPTRKRRLSEVDKNGKSYTASTSAAHDHQTNADTITRTSNKRYYNHDITTLDLSPASSTAGAGGEIVKPAKLKKVHDSFTGHGGQGTKGNNKSTAKFPRFEERPDPRQQDPPQQQAASKKASKGKGKDREQTSKNASSDIKGKLEAYRNKIEESEIEEKRKAREALLAKTKTNAKNTRGREQEDAGTRGRVSSRFAAEEKKTSTSKGSGKGKGKKKGR